MDIREELNTVRIPSTKDFLAERNKAIMARYDELQRVNVHAKEAGFPCIARSNILEKIAVEAGLSRPQIIRIMNKERVEDDRD